jgi:putative ABC transport system permease protein
MMTIARLKRGVTIARAQQDMDRVQSEMIRLFPAFNTGWRVRVRSLTDQLTSGVRPALLVLLGAVGFVMLIACANVANLLLARATTRQRELAVRAALGADRRRLLQQAFTESAVLAAAGAGAGLVLAWWAINIVRTTVAVRLPVPRLDAVAIDPHVLGFVLGAGAFCACVFGVLPALSASGGTVTLLLKDGGRTGTGARGVRARNVLVVVETALALVLLVAAALLGRSFIALMRVDPGFDPAHTISMKVTLPEPRYREGRQFFDQLYAGIDALPGVEASGGVSFLPMNGLGAATDFSIVGRATAAPGNEAVADVRVVTHDYFKAMRIPLLRGRLFDSRDAGSQRNHVIVSAELARRFFPDIDPIGKQIVIDWTDRAPDEIIGVVGDVHQLTLDDEIRPTTYWPPSRFGYPWNSVVIRTSADPSRLVPQVGALVHRFDPTIALADVRTLDDVMSISVAERRLTMLLLASFAAVALLLAAGGIYGVVSYSVTERTHEIGIRMALGAARERVMRMVLGEALALVGSGVVAGALGAWLLTRMLRTLLFGVKPTDPATFAAVAALLTAVAAIAAWIPGLRATRVDPVVALRSE